jgi:sugar O-acyltransferase (sialic acid O-acetyltransferase NeuD family)
MSAVVIFALGSPLIVDVEESLARAGFTLAAGIRNVETPSRLLGDVPVLSASEVTPALFRVPFIVPLFGPANRQKAAGEAFAMGFVAGLSLIDPTAIRPRTLHHGAGLYVNAGCILAAGCTFGDFVLINRGASIGHHARLSDFVSIGPGAVLAGQVSVGRGAVIGAGAVIMPKVTIGENAVVSAGAIVGKDVPPMSVAAGNPARIVKRSTTGYGGLTVV